MNNAEYMSTTVERLTADLDAAKALLKEVNGWHSDPESAEFNDCYWNPCDWCKRALELIKEKNA